MTIDFESEFLPMPHLNYVPIGRIFSTTNFNALQITKRYFIWREK